MSGHPRHVYFIKPAGADGPIKIGVSGTLSARLSSLQTVSPVPLELLLSIPGDAAVERTLHEHFADARSHGEWFRPTAELLTFIEALRKGTPLVDLIDVCLHRPTRTAQIIDALGGPTVVGRICGFEKNPGARGSDFKQRDSIPVEYWPHLVAAAQEKDDLEITYETLVKAHAREPERVAS